MRRFTKSWVALGASAAGLALHPVSPIASAVVTGLAPYVAFANTFTFNVPLSRAVFRATAAVNALAVFLASGSVPLALAALLAFLSNDAPDPLKMGSLGVVGTTALRYPTVIAAIACLVAAWPTGAIGWVLAPSFAAMAGGLLVTADAWRELLPNRTGPHDGLARIGSPAPELALPRRSGDGEFRLSEHRGENLLLCFLRGDWCPFCQVLMRSYGKAAPKLQEMGVKLVMINPSSGEEARAFARDMGLDYEILVDADLKAAEAMGIVSKGKGLDGKHYPLPISILVDRNGVVRFISGIEDLSALAPEKLNPALELAERAGGSARPAINASS